VKVGWLMIMRLVGDIWRALVFYQSRVSGRVCGWLPFPPVSCCAYL